MSLNFQSQKVIKCNLPLYLKRGPMYSDIKQSIVGSCWFLSSICSVLAQKQNLLENQKIITKMIELYDSTAEKRDTTNAAKSSTSNSNETNDKNTYKIRIYDKYFLIDDYVPDKYLTDKHACKWFILLEKALISYYTKSPKTLVGTNLYLCEDLDLDAVEQEVAANGLKYIFRTPASYKIIQSRFKKIFKIEDLLHLFKTKKYLVVNTSNQTYQVNSRSVQSAYGIKCHSYAILDVKEQFAGNSETTHDCIVTIYNPWGSKGIAVNSESGHTKLSFSAFMTFFSCIHYLE